jgi:hypothetical protein
MSGAAPFFLMVALFNRCTWCAVGDSTERVDARVLQVIYRIEDDNLQLFVGQQMDVFIDAADVRTAMKR